MSISVIIFQKHFSSEIDMVVLTEDSTLFPSEEKQRIRVSTRNSLLELESNNGKKGNTMSREVNIICSTSRQKYANIPWKEVFIGFIFLSSKT